MKIDPDKCISCLECIDFCTMKCILEGDEAVFIDQDECVECGVCLRADVCPEDAIYMPGESMQYPRSIRREFSDPGVQYPTLKQGGRGTEEMKTNDVKGSYLPGEVGVGVELGRPGVGAFFRDIEIVAMALMGADIGYEMAEENPVTHFMEDKSRGKLRDDLLGEKTTSAMNFA